MSNQQYRLPVYAIQIDRGAMSKVSIVAPATVIPVLEAMYGESAVRQSPPTETYAQAFHDATPAEEYARLERVYKRDSESNILWVERAYGAMRAGGIENIMREEHNPDLKGIAEGGEEAQAQDVNAEQVPPAIDPDDGDVQAELDHDVLPAGKDALQAELEDLGCSFKTRDTVPHLEAMLRTARDIEAIGGEIAQGANLDALTSQLDQLTAAANAGDNDVQAELEAQANES